MCVNGSVLHTVVLLGVTESLFSRVFFFDVFIMCVNGSVTRIVVFFGCY